MSQMDMDLKKAFTEMQINTIETSKNIKMLDMKCDMVKAGKHKYQLTEKVTSDLTDDTRVYLSVGRMFVLTNVDDIRKDLKAKQEKCDQAIDFFTERKEFFATQLKEQEDSLRELVKQRKDAEPVSK